MGRAKVLGLAGTWLALEQADPDIGEAQLALGCLAKRVQGLPLWEGTVNHLRERGVDSHLAACIALNLNGYLVTWLSSTVTWILILILYMILVFCVLIFFYYLFI